MTDDEREELIGMLASFEHRIREIEMHLNSLKVQVTHYRLLLMKGRKKGEA